MIATSTTFEQKLREGTAFAVSTTRLSIGALGYLRLTVQNTSSTKPIIIYNCVTTGDITALNYIELRKNPSSGLPTTVLTPFNPNLGSSNSTIATIKADVSAVTPLAGGTYLSNYALANGRNYYQDTVLILPPLTTIGINVVATTAILNAVLEMYYWEEN